MPDTARMLRQLTRQDVYHFNGIRAIYLSAAMPRLGPSIGTKHLPYASEQGETLKTRLARMASRWVFHRLDWLISISDTTLQELPPEVRRRSSVVLNGVVDHGAHLETTGDNSEFTVCFVGRFVEHKGLMRLLGAVRILVRQGRAPRLLLAGGGPLEVPARAFVEQHGLGHRVEFLGYVQDPGTVFRRSHACVLPSLHEGLPLSLLEAMSARCALVGHPIPGVRDVLRADANGVFADVSPESLASVLAALDDDRARLGRLRRTSRADYEHSWRVERMVDETEAIYRRVISEAGR
jgi:glycosyltransferase involved in cell wall biosynthesis